MSENRISFTVDGKELKLSALVALQKLSVPWFKKKLIFIPLQHPYFENFKYLKNSTYPHP